MQKTHDFYGFTDRFSVSHLVIFMAVQSDGTVGVKYYWIIIGIFLPSISTGAANGYRCQRQKKMRLLAEKRNIQQN